MITGLTMPRSRLLTLQALLLFFSYCGTGQSFNEHRSFLEHLYANEMYAEGIDWIHFKKPFTDKDSTNYWLGKYFYQLKESDSSIYYLGKVSSRRRELSDFSIFFRSFQLANEGKVENAHRLLTSYEIDTRQESSQLRLLELAGLALLKRDYSSYDNLRSKISDAYYLTPYTESFDKVSENIRSFKEKSPFLAGLYSTALPGGGRFYINRPGEGVAALLVTGVFGLQALEGYRKDGPQSARFILFGSLFSISYVANIWGSVLAVQVRRNEHNQQVDDTILLNMHVPLRVLLD